MRAAEEELATQQTQLLQILHDDKMCEVGVYGCVWQCKVVHSFTIYLLDM